MKNKRILLNVFAPFFAVLLILVPMLGSTNPDTKDPQSTAAQNSEIDTRTLSIDSYRVKRGLTNLTKRANSTRERLSNISEDILAVSPIELPTAVEGTIEIPILLSLFMDTNTPPFKAEELQQQLFKGPWPTGTMHEHYMEMSRNKLDVSGTVGQWKKLSANEDFFTGPLKCNGICNQANLDSYIVSTLSLYDDEVDFGKYDNDGPDGLANSGDDDGFADFVAFVHPAKGGECNDGSFKHIWSHRYSVSSLTGSNFVTNDNVSGGGKILIDDYVIMPGLSCDGSSMIQIGVFSHEFAHAFGLPDLYDSKKPVTSAGIGGWGLMASGSWGGSGSDNPESPTHMSAWSKEYLGWIDPIEIDKDTKGVEINPYVVSGEAVRVDYSDAENPEDDTYLLLTFRTKEGFDKSLISQGLLVEEISNSVVEGGLVSNGVNGNGSKLGVNIIEADGKRELDTNINRADGGDVFPGTENASHLDKTSSESISAALCNIMIFENRIKLDIYISRTVCPETLKNAAHSPEVTRTESIVRGQEVIIEGILLNEGENLQNDRKLILRSPLDGSEIYVMSPEVFGAALSGSSDNSPETVTDLVGERIVIRGEIRKMSVKGLGEVDVLISKEHQKY